MLNIFEDIRGKLLPIEFGNIPFDIKRIFLVYDVPAGTERGNHAHHDTIQLLVCIKGEILVKLYDGKNTEEILLIEGDHKLVNKMIWDSQVFQTGNDVLLVLCSTSYNEIDYITDKKEFEKLCTI